MSKNCVFIALITAVVLFCSCERENQNSSGKEGTLRIYLNPSSEIDNVVATRSDDVTLPSVDDFSLKIYRGNDLKGVWDKFNEYQNTLIFPIGNYTAEAYYGDIEIEGWESPYFYGSKDFTIKDQETTEETITCTLQNTQVSIAYSESFKNFFESYSVKITSSLNNIITFNPAEIRAAYFKPGTLDITASVSKQGSNAVLTIPVKQFEALANHIYNISLDVDANAATLTVTFSEDVDIEPIIIDISDAALSSAAPYFTTEGFTSGQEQEFIEGTASENTIHAYLSAEAGVSSYMLATSSKALLEQGWPAEVDLVNLTAAQKTTMASLGLSVKGLDVNSEGIVVVDFTNVIPFLEYDSENAMNTFTLSATDNLGRTSDEPITLKIKSLDNGFSFVLPASVPYDSQSIIATVTLKSDISKVAFKVYSFSAWQDITPTSINSNGDEHTLVFNFSLPLVNTETGLRMKALLNRREIEVTSNIDPPIITATATSIGAIWATTASFTITSQVPATRALAMSRVMMEYEQDGSWIKPDQTQSGNEITVTSLNPATSYTFRARYADGTESSNDSTSPEVTVTTEEALQVPNADMDGWNIEATKKLGEGKWNGLNPTTYNAYIPNSGSWTTTNAKTFNHSDSGNMNYAINAYPSVISDAHDTGSAAMIRSIGWTVGAGNSYPGVTLEVCKEWSAGKMFLGDYDFNKDTYEETYNYGIAFASRPKSIAFQYKYESYNNDKFKVWAVVENRANGEVKRLAYGEIAAGNAASAYTDIAIDLNYDSSYLDLKATHFYIAFSSSNKANDTHATESNAMEEAKLLRVVNSSYWGGSILYIDNIQLNY